MSKITVKKIVSVFLAIVLCVGIMLGMNGAERAKAQPNVDNEYWGAEYDDMVEYLNYAKAFGDGFMDPINGEVVLTADKKANVLTNIKKNGQKLTILEIVPYELMSIYSIFAPNSNCEKIMNAYGDWIFRDYETVKPNTCVLAEGGLEREGFFLLDGYDYNSIRGRTGNHIADADHPIEITKIGDTYKSKILNYYIENLLDEKRESSVYKYFANNDNVEVKVVVPGKTSNEELEKILLGDGDPVDFIYVGSYLEGNGNYGNNGVILRNLFFSQGSFDADGNYVIDNETKTDMYDLLRNGNITSAMDNKYHTGVYKKSGSSYVEYKLSELYSSKVSFDSYSKVGSNYVPNDLNWDAVKKLMAYIFGYANTNYIYVPVSEDGRMGTPQQQRISCVMQLDKRKSSNYFCDNTSRCQSNIGKLYFLLAKTTDQANDKDKCEITHPAGFGTGTHTMFCDIATCYHDPNYFMKYFSETKPDGSKYYNSNGVTTAAYNGDVAWPLEYNNNIYRVTTQDTWSWTSKTGTEYTYRLPEGKYSTPDIVLFDWADAYRKDLAKNLFYTSNILDGLYIVYNSVIGVDGEKTRNMFDSGLSVTHSAGGFRKEGVYNRIEDAVGITFTQYNVVNYLLGIDDSDFLTPPDAEFENAQQAVNENVYTVYLYDGDNDTDSYTVKYSISDENRKMVDAKLIAKYKTIVGGVPTTKEKVVKTYSRAEVFGHEKITDTFVISADDPELYAAFQNMAVEFELTVTNELSIIKKNRVTGEQEITLKNLSDTAYLYMVYRDIKDLD